MINIALPKGRLFREIYSFLEKNSITFDGLNPEKLSRKLFFVNHNLNIRCFLAKPYDIPAYVEKGAADLGICGNDVIQERNADVFELADIHAGECFIASAGLKSFRDDKTQVLRVCTEYPHITREFYRKKGRDIETVTLKGAMELAPLTGLCDVIVDIVQTGKTLSENNLEVIEKICRVSARIISNKSAYYFRGKEISEIIRRAS